MLLSDRDTNADHGLSVRKRRSGLKLACTGMVLAIATFLSLLVNANTVLADDFDLAFEAAEKGNHELAIHFYTKAIRSGELSSENLVYAYNNRGYSFEQLGDYESSIRDYSTAIQQNPDYVQAIENRGIVYYLSGASKRAISDFDEVLRLEPDNVDVILSRAVAYTSDNQFARALEDLSVYIDKRPSDAQGYLVSASTKFMLGRFPEAANDYGTSLELGWDGIPPKIYAEIWLFLSRERIGHDGETRLRKVADSMDKQSWPEPIVSLFLGKTSVKEVLAAAREGDQLTLLERECEAFFYLGQHQLLNRNIEAAADFFERTLATGVTEFYEYDFAKAELERLYAAAPPKKLELQ